MASGRIGVKPSEGRVVLFGLQDKAVVGLMDARGLESQGGDSQDMLGLAHLQLEVLDEWLIPVEVLGPHPQSLA